MRTLLHARATHARTAPTRSSFLAVAAFGVSLVCASSVSAQTILTGELLTNPGAESNLTGWAITSGVGYLADAGTYDPGYNPHSGTRQFVAGAAPGASGTLGQLVNLTSLSSVILDRIDAGLVSADVSLWYNIYYQGGLPDYLHVTLTFQDASSNSLGTATTADLNSSYSGGSLWNYYSNSFAVPVGTRAITYTIVSQRGANGGSYIDAFSDDHSLVLSTVPEPASSALVGGLLVCIAALTVLRRRTAGQPHGPPPRPVIP